MRVRCVLLSALSVLVLLAGSLLSTGTARAVAPGPATTSADHPFSDPVWLPLRTPAKVGCARTGCDNSTGAHGFWAIDFLGSEGDLVYAAGAGVAHIGGDSGGCQQSGEAPDDPAHRGRWVWIDHGAGVVSQYRHLGSIAITDGQLVTPDTVIGTMGHSGDVEPCTTNYVHFEVHHGGLSGEPVDFGSLRACTADGEVSLPEVWGASNWDDPRVHPSPRLQTPEVDDNCMDPSWLTTPAAPTASATAAPAGVNVSWDRPPSDTASIAVTLESYQSSTDSWGGIVYREVDAATSSVAFSGLTNGRRYRTQVFFRDDAGTSGGSTYNTATPIDKPGATDRPRFLTWPKATYIHYGWQAAPANGSAVTSYTVAWRCARSSGSAFGSWSKKTQAAGSYYRNIEGVKAYHRCEVKVRASNAAGTGPYTAAQPVNR